MCILSGNLLENRRPIEAGRFNCANKRRKCAGVEIHRARLAHQNANHAQRCASRDACPVTEFLQVRCLFFLLSYRRIARIAGGSTFRVEA